MLLSVCVVLSVNDVGSNLFERVEGVCVQLRFR